MLKGRTWANWWYLYKTAVFGGCCFLFSGSPGSHLWALTVQAAAKGVFFNAEIVFGIVPVPGPLDCTTGELKHLKSHKQISSMEATSWGTWGHHGPWGKWEAQGKRQGGVASTGGPKRKRKNRSARLRETTWYMQCYQSLFDIEKNTCLGKRTGLSCTSPLQPNIELSTKEKFCLEPISTQISPFSIPHFLSSKQPAAASFQWRENKA